MTDLDLTKACAKKMGLHWIKEWRDCVLLGDSMLSEYDPLHDDEQAMALVKRFNIGWDKEDDSDWHVALRIGSNLYASHNPDLNRAIVECVAKL